MSPKDNAGNRFTVWARWYVNDDIYLIRKYIKSYRGVWDLSFHVFIDIYYLSGQHGAHLGPVGPSWAPCRPHEPFYQGIFAQNRAMVVLMVVIHCSVDYDTWYVYIYIYVYTHIYI